MAAACESPLVENTILIGTLYPWKKMNSETTNPSLGDIFKDPLPPLFDHVPTPSSSSSSSSSQQPEEEEEEEEICMDDQKEEVQGGSTCDPLVLDPSPEKEVKMEEEEEKEEEEEEEEEEDEEAEEEAMKEAAAVERKQYYYLPPRKKRKGLVFWRSGSLGGQFPPPITSISVSSSKPWMYFKSYRQEGRFVFKKIMLPTLELLHASREDGRLRMHFIHRSQD